MASRWPQEEYDKLDSIYPDGGPKAVHAAMPHHSIDCIRKIAFTRGIVFLHRVTPAKIAAAIEEARRELRPSMRNGPYLSVLAAQKARCTPSAVRSHIRRSKVNRVKHEAEIVAYLSDLGPPMVTA